MKKLVLLCSVLILFECSNKQEFNFHTNIIAGLKESRITGKPIFLLFYVYGIGYDSFKYKLISNKDIVQKLNKNFVNVILYCDDPRKINQKDTMSFEDYGFDLLLRPYLSKIQTIGNLNAFLEIVLYDIRTQPLYVIMDSKMNLIIDHFGSVRDPEILESKLSEALQKLN